MKALRARAANIIFDLVLVEIVLNRRSDGVRPFEILGVDRPGLLKDVLDVLASMNKSANRVAADVQSSTKARIHVRIDVKDQGEIEFIKQNVARIADVTRVYRSRPGLKA